MYLDDHTNHAAINYNENKNKFRNELNELVNWAYKWQLKINYDKCLVVYTLVIIPCTFIIILDMRNIIARRSNSEKVSRIYIDENLSFKEHVYE